MNSIQLELVQREVDLIYNLNMEYLLNNTYSMKESHNTIVQGFNIGKKNPIEIVDILKTSLENLKDAIIKNHWKRLPFSIQDVSILSQLQAINIGIKSNSKFDSWVHLLEWLVNYEIRNNIWKDSELNELSDKSDENRIDKTEKHIKAKFKEINELHKKSFSRQKDLDKFLQKSISEYNGLANNIELSIKNLRNSELQIADSKGRIDAVLQQLSNEANVIQQNIDNENDKLLNIEHQHRDTQKKLDEAVNNVTLFEKTIENIINDAKDKSNHILDQETEINKLRGIAADAALGGVFGHRSKQMAYPVNIWIAISIITIIAAIIWIDHVFNTNASINKNGVNWIAWLTNLLRTSPAFIFIYFCLSQYTKERNIQEEYAFKAAVSMTVTAYAEMIGSGASPDDERVKMLSQTIQGIYTPPILGRPFKPVNLETKDISEASKTMADALKNFQTIITDAIKAAKSA